MAFKNESHAKRLVLGNARMHGFDVCVPTRRAREILIMDWRSGKGLIVADSRKWSDAYHAMLAYVSKLLG